MSLIKKVLNVLKTFTLMTIKQPACAQIIFLRYKQISLYVLKHAQFQVIIKQLKNKAIV